MKWKIEFITPEGYIRVTIEGVYTATEHLQMMTELFGSPFWQPDLPILLDTLKLDYSQADLIELEKSSRDVLVNNAQIGNAKIAFLTNSIKNYDVIRQFELITEEEVSAWMHVFLDENQALRWLLAYRVKQTGDNNLYKSQ